jgi:hypothetical protein
MPASPLCGGRGFAIGGNARILRYGEMSLENTEGGPRRREAAAGFTGATAIKLPGSILNGNVLSKETKDIFIKTKGEEHV